MSFPHLIRREHGFTLVEMLTVCAILGILAAVSLSTFAGQDESALDAQAKANVRNLFSHVQTCFTETEDYTLCDEPSELAPNLGVTFGTGPDQVEIRRNGNRTTRLQVTIRAFSKAVTDGENHQFTFIKRAGPPPDTRSCRAGDGNNAGACHDGTW